MDLDDFELSLYSIRSQELGQGVTEVLDLGQAGHEDEDWALLLIFLVYFGDLFDDEVNSLMQFFVCAGVLIAEDDWAPFDIQGAFRQESIERVEIVVLPLVFARFSDIDGRTGPLRSHELKPIVVVDLPLVFTLNLHFIIFLFLLCHPMLLLGFLLRHYYLFVEILRGEDVVDVVWCKVEPEELVVDGRTH